MLTNIDIQILRTKKHMHTTKAICNKGFSGNSIILPRIKFCVSRQDTSPLSLTAYSLNRCAQYEKTAPIKFALNNLVSLR